METEIYKKTQYGEFQIGSIKNNVVYDLTGTKPVGSVTAENRIMRNTVHSDQDLGYATEDGEVFSNGLFEGGSIGWVEDDGIVVQAGLILGEEDVGRVVGPQLNAGAAALLLHFLPLDAEEQKQMNQR